MLENIYEGMVLISICTPVLNDREKMIKYLKQFEAQSDKNFEIVIVDGGSTDGTLELLHEHQSTMPMLKVYNEKGAKKCTGNARDQAIKKATGKYVIIIDSDVIIEKDLIKKMNHLAAAFGEYDLISMERYYEIPKLGNNKLFFYRDNLVGKGGRTLIKRSIHPGFCTDCSFGEDRLLDEKLSRMKLKHVGIEGFGVTLYHDGIHNMGEFLRRYIWYGKSSPSYFRKTTIGNKIPLLITWIAGPIFPLGIILGAFKGINHLLKFSRYYPERNIGIYLGIIYLELVSVFAFSYGFYVFLLSGGRKLSR